MSLPTAENEDHSAAAKSTLGRQGYRTLGLNSILLGGKMGEPNQRVIDTTAGLWSALKRCGGLHREVVELRPGGSNAYEVFVDRYDGATLLDGTGAVVILTTWDEHDRIAEVVCEFGHGEGEWPHVARMRKGLSRALLIDHLMEPGPSSPPCDSGTAMMSDQPNRPRTSRHTASSPDRRRRASAAHGPRGRLAHVVELPPTGSRIPVQVRSPKMIAPLF